MRPLLRQKRARLRPHWGRSALVALACAVLARSAHAQDRFDAEAFDPVPEQAVSILRVSSARPLPKGTYALGLIGSYARRPLSLKNAEGGADLGELIGSMGTLSLLATLGVSERFDLGVAVPMHRVSAGSPLGGSPPAVAAARVSETKLALGDIRLVPRVALLKREPDSGFGLALLLPLSLPTGNNDLYAGESFRAEPRVAADAVFGRVLLAANLGYQVRKRALVIGNRVDDMLRWGIGGEVLLAKPISAIAELTGGINVLAREVGKTDLPMEGMLGLRLRQAGLLAQLAGGTGLVRGLSAPQYRLVLSVGYATELPPPNPDPDGDGLVGAADRCPNDAEDKDGFEDQDGCPDPDNDIDGVPDASDACANQPEDKDGFEDQDGCPDPDNDKDGVPDASDACPDKPEDKDGFEDQDGCPDPDNDKDGIEDSSDRCPLEAGVLAEAGCPAKAAPSAVQVTQTTIELNQNVFFGLNSAVILGESMPLMDELAKVIKDHEELKLVVVEGHTDDRGSKNLNAQLSKARAQAVVEALVTRGVARERLRGEGFGPDRPLVPNDSDENRAKNRRVQLRIEQRAN